MNNMGKDTPKPVAPATGRLRLTSHIVTIDCDRRVVLSGNVHALPAELRDWLAA